MWSPSLPLRAQRLLEIRDQIILVLDADRQAHHVRCGAGLHLGRIVELTGGRSLAANIALVKNNVTLAAEIAVALSALPAR